MTTGSQSNATRRIAIFPGSFDPFTIGHEQIVMQSLELFDKVIVAVGHSLSKSALLSVEDRIAALERTFAGIPRVEAVTFKGLVVEFARKQKARFLIRGLRSSNDFDYELPMAHTNHCLAPDIQTLFIPTAADKSFISSTLVREVVKNGGDYTPFVPREFFDALNKLSPRP